VPKASRLHAIDNDPVRLKKITDQITRYLMALGWTAELVGEEIMRAHHNNSPFQQYLQRMKLQLYSVTQ